MSRPTLVILICLGSILNSYGQMIQGKILSQEDQPVADAFVFISNSNYGVVSDENGIFEIESSGTKSLELTVSQINFTLRTETVQINGEPIIIKLEPKINEVISVELTQRYDPKIRERRLKRFSASLLGTDIKDRNIKILNIEDILIYHEENALKIEASGPILIENKKLGYLLRFFVSDFVLYDNEDLIYKGAVFFEDLQMKRREMAKAKKNRKKAYRLGSRMFLNELTKRGSLDRYVVSLGRFVDARGGYYDYDKIDPENLQVSYLSDQRLYSLSIATVLKVYDKKTNVASYLKPLESKILIDTYGNIVNSSRVEELGFWSERRLGTLLPFDYSPEP